jgi:Flp pilus assembly protein TadG
MRWLISMQSRRDERGATALMIAIMVPTVFLGLGAIVVNVGGWYVARGMDQNGADAAALAVAKSCADGTCDAAEADQYANADSNGQLAGQATFVCGTAPGLTGCDPGIEGGQVCPAANEAPYVDVLVAPAGGSMANFTSGTQSVAACAQAALDSVGSCEDCAALTISECEWNSNTADGTAFATPGSIPTYLNTITRRRESSLFGAGVANFFQIAKIYDPMNPKAGYTPSPPAPANAAIAGSETVIKAQGSFGNSCGSSAPGNFEWLSNSACSVSVDSDGTYQGDTGSNAPDGCEAVFKNSRATGTPIYLPVFSTKTLSGSNVSYTLAGFAAFVVTGWDLNTGAGDWDDKTLPSTIGAAADQPAGVRRGQYCGKPPNGYTKASGGGQDQCVYGYFTEALVPNGHFDGGGPDNLGLTVTSLTG